MDSTTIITAIASVVVVLAGVIAKLAKTFWTFTQKDLTNKHTEAVGQLVAMVSSVENLTKAVTINNEQQGVLIKGLNARLDEHSDKLDKIEEISETTAVEVKNTARHLDQLVHTVSEHEGRISNMEKAHTETCEALIGLTDAIVQSGIDVTKKHRKIS